MGRWLLKWVGFPVRLVLFVAWFTIVLVVTGLVCPKYFLNDWLPDVGADMWRAVWQKDL